MKKFFTELFEKATQETETSKPATFRTAEEEGYLQIFYSLHKAVREAATSIIVEEDADRLLALKKFRDIYDDWYVRLKVTLPPDSMLEPGNNVRDQILRLLEKSKKLKRRKN